MPVRVYRTAYSRAVPPSAQQLPGGRVRWKGRTGRMIEAELLPDGRCRVTVTDCWYYSFTAPDGRPVKNRKGLADKAATEALARAAQLASDRQRAGLAAPADCTRPNEGLHDHLAAYLEWLRHRGRTPNYRADCERRIRHVLAMTRATRAEELTPGAVEVAAATGEGGKARGTTTRRGYLRAVRTWLTWCRRERRVTANPLADIVSPLDRAGLRRRRRRLTDGELAQVLAVARAAAQPLRRSGVPVPHGPARELLYLTAAGTGLRAAELAALTPASLYFDGPAPYLALRAGQSKRRREDLQPLPRDVAERLRDYCQGRPRNAPLWPGRWYRRAARMLRADLAVAGIAYEDDRGRRADFHSLRRTFVRRLRDAGVDARDAQRLARHSTVTLTLEVYEDEQELSELSAAVDRLPSLTRPLTLPVPCHSESLPVVSSDQPDPNGRGQSATR